jgi:transposase InsO family protein
LCEIDRSEVLFRKNVTQERVSWQKLVPQTLQEKVMKMFHEGFGHPRATRALETIRLHYYWEGQREEFTAHCRECLSCQLRNAYIRKPKTPVQVPGRVGADGQSSYRPDRTTSGNEYILVVKDFLPRYVWLFAVPDKSAEWIAQILLERVISPFGPPQMLVSDRGREFTNKINKRLSQLFRINRVSKTPYNPRANGMVEQHNGTLKSQLYHFVDVRQRDWDQFLSTVQLM